MLATLHPTGNDLWSNTYTIVLANNIGIPMRQAHCSLKRPHLSYNLRATDSFDLMLSTVHDLTVDSSKCMQLQCTNN